MNISQALRVATVYVRAEQQADGSFKGVASADKHSARFTRSQPTIFPTILALDCLSAVPAAKDIQRRSAQYVQSQVSRQGAWNYWDRQSAAVLQEPYPDDLDDTACALAALAKFEPALVSATSLGQFARLLIAAEHSTGGPYNTWLTNYTIAPQWKQSDLAVNANIGYSLHLQGVKTKSLMNYIDSNISGNDFISAYYVGEVPVLYFLARWYQGAELATLRAKIDSLLHAQLNTLEQALLLAAASNMGVDPLKTKHLVDSLLGAAHEGHWQAEALYVDPVYEGRQHYGGSELLTTVFVMEALALYEQKSTISVQVPRRAKRQSQILRQVRQEAASITDAPLRRQYLRMARQITEGKRGNQIAEAATIIATAGGWDMPADFLLSVNAASLNGWIAYTVYDDILDGHGSPKQLGVANIALRRSYNNFIQDQPQNSAFKQLVTSTFDAIDSANAWELRHARASIEDGEIELTKLPDYGQYAQLAQRSMGHGLAANAVLFTQFESVDHPCLKSMQQFFYYFLIARQLNDDAHDWEADLRDGHISAVVAMLLNAKYKMPCQIALIDELESLRQHFWRYTIDEVGIAMQTNIAQAQSYLQECEQYMDTTEFNGWLNDLESSVTAALSTRSETLAFMKAYEASYV